MSDDLLERATRALKESGEPSSEELRRTRMRVMDTARSSQRRRARVVYVAFPIAAVLVATTAWAASTGRLGAAVRGVKNLFSPAEPTVALSAPPPPTVATQPPPPEQPREEAPAPPAPEPEPPPPPVVSAPPPPRPSVVAPPKVADADVDDASSVDITLYKHAHRLHFVDKSYGAALDAWDEYLRGSPGGAFVIEARYNRAICLVKLGRKAEARIALQPFADGKVGGGYRRDEAAKLLDALDSN